MTTDKRKTSVGPAALQQFIATGLEGLVDEIPDLIRDARLHCGANDIALAIFVDDDGKAFKSYGKDRTSLRKDLAGFVSVELLKRFEPPPTLQDVPVFVQFLDHVFAFVYAMHGTEGVLS